MTWFAGQAVVRMGPVCRVGRVPVGAGSIKFFPGELREKPELTYQVSPSTVAPNTCVLRKESSEMGLPLSRLSGA